MRLSTTTGDINRTYSLEEIIDIYSNAGYDAIDCSFCEKGEELLYGKDREYFKELRKKAEDKGLYFNQAHAPFHSSFYDEEATKKRFEEIVRSMEYASVLGVYNIVVHPCQHLPYNEPGVSEILFEMNMDFYNRLKPYCEEYGIRVAVENMWHCYGETTKIVHSTCSRPEEFVRYVDELNSEWFVACLDIGHAVLVCENPANFVRALGKERLHALHVHDVDGIHDSHTLPYFGCCNWEEVMKALAEIDYDGDLTFEACNFLNKKPVELQPEYEKIMAKTGKHLINIFNSAKK